MRGLITRRHEPRLSSLLGVCVQREEHGHAPKYTLLSRRLRRFIYLLDSCPERLTRFSTSAVSHQTRCLLFSRLRMCLSHTRTPWSPACCLQGYRLCASPHRLFFVTGCLSGFFPFLFLYFSMHFPPTRLCSFYLRLLFRIPVFFSLVFCPYSRVPSLTLASFSTLLTPASLLPSQTSASYLCSAALC